MPPQNQRKSSSSEDLDEYLKFKQGQQAQQAMSLQQLGAMSNMSQQQVANEIARANLELTRSNQGIAQGRLDLDIASNPSIIQSRIAEAAYNQARADGLPEEQASLIAARAATTKQTEALTAGQGITNSMAQNLADNQALVLEQQARAGEANIAQTDASTSNLKEQAKALGYTNLFGEKDAESRSNLLFGQNRKFNIELDRLPTDYMYKDAETNARLAATAATAHAQVLANNDLPRRIAQDEAAARMQLQLGGASIAAQAYNNIGQNLQNENMPTMYASQRDLTAAQIQASLAGTAFSLYDRNGLTLQQLQNRALTPKSMVPIQKVYDATAAANKVITDADEARQRQAAEAARQSAGMFNMTDVPADLQPAYAAELAKQAEFYKTQQIKTDEINAIRKRNAIEQQLNRMQFADSPDFGSSSY
jgi:hypothetical protein